jgi:hypothetical protein
MPSGAAVRFQFVEEKLRKLYCEATTESDLMPPASLPAFFEVMAMIGSARDESDLAVFVSLGLARLDAPADDLRLLLIDDDHALVIGLTTDARGPLARIHEVVRRN